MGIRHLEKAIELEPSLIEYSKADSNLENIRENPEFQQLINPEEIRLKWIIVVN